MGFFDAIKDALTVDDQERLEAARKDLDQAKADLEKVRNDPNRNSATNVGKAEKDVADAQARVDEYAAKVGGTPAPTDPAPVNPEPVNPAPVDAAPADPAPAPVPAPPADAEKQDKPEKKHAELKEERKPDRKPAPNKTYTVKKGDTLSEIGQKFGVSWREIAKLNDIDNPDLIFPGQVFKIPNK